MNKQLVIVESPAKAKTIEKYLGTDYEVRSSFGHIRDLPKKHLNIDIEHDFKPTYAISDDKKKVVADLKKATKTAKDVWLASDEDREGEAIAWHLCQALGLDTLKTKRIVFHEITKPAITNAMANPRTIDLKLVDAQQARRILDRIVGYELSPVLWKKVRPGLSAGRVQSVAVRLVVEREREIRDFKPESKYRVTATFDVKGVELPAELSEKFDNKENAIKLVNDCKEAIYKVVKIEHKPGKRSPGPPFTTSTLQQDAARLLGFSVKQTMTLAQRLYENGFITYMRTDSTILSNQALTDAKSYIVKNFGSDYHHQRQFKTKQSNAQEAHEAIRPTNFSTLSVSDEGQNKLYKLIWRRSLSSQMSDAQLSKTDISISISTRKELFNARGEIVSFDGYLKVYGRSGEDILLPDLSLNQELPIITLLAKQTFSRSQPRYSEATLVRKLEELGIGRPSTYAPTISTIQSRGYVEKTDIETNQREVNTITLEKGNITEKTETENFGADRAKLLPTPLADVTTDFLIKNFKAIVDYDFTANAEKDFDLIAEGQEDWVDMLKKFYKSFHVLVEKSDNISREESTQTRQLGVDPKSKRPIFARYGRYGPMLQKGETTDEDKPSFASLPANTTLESVTLEDALEMFNLPRKVGLTKDGETIEANIGRFGPYIQVKKTYVSIKGYDPLTITEPEARELFEEKAAQLANKYIQEFKNGIKVVNGPYGPYITDGKKNVRIPKDKDAQALTEVEAKELIAAAPTKRRIPRKRRIVKSRK